MRRSFNSHLGWKLFLSYMLVILVGVLVLASAASFFVPSAFQRHLAVMGQMMSSSAQDSARVNADLYTNFLSAVGDALTLAALAAFIAAILTSVFVSRQVVAPVRAMMLASQRIAEGRFNERVRIPGKVSDQELDELAQLALSFNQMAERLEQTEALRRQLIGDVAHELRTPLTTIKGSLEGLIDGVLPAEAETYQQVYQEVDRLQRLVADLQELSRVEAGAYCLNIQPLRLPAIIAAVRTRLERQYEEKGVALAIDLAPDLPAVQADEDRLMQVLLNLMGNALQYTPSGGRVTVSARAKEKFVQVAVQDTGIGIPAEYLAHIFTRFFRVDKSRSRAGGGSGIGLTIAKSLVEAQGGTISVYSAGAGKGSTFSFTLPGGSK